jgi:nitrogen regulatory protein PII
MKLILIIFDSDKEDKINEILTEARVTGFTTWGPVHGKGKHSDPRMGSQVWPGDNRIIMAAVPDETAAILRKTLLSHTEAGNEKGIKVFELNTNTWI